jgi:Tol biopolymer transport system component
MSMEKFTKSGHAKIATISPDGKYIVHAMVEPDRKQSLWICHVATGSNTEIQPPADANYFGMSISPDGNFLYFVRREASNPTIGVLYQIPVLGGTPRRLVNDMDSAISFAPDGEHFVFLRNSESESESRLIIANADGSGERVLARHPKPGYSDPVWSLDGKMISAVILDPGGSGLERIVTLNPATGKEKSIFAATALLSRPAWMPDSRTLAFVFSDVSTNWYGQIGEITVPGGKSSV